MTWGCPKTVMGENNHHYSNRGPLLNLHYSLVRWYYNGIRRVCSFENHNLWQITVRTFWTCCNALQTYFSECPWSSTQANERQCLRRGLHSILNHPRKFALGLQIRWDRESLFRITWINCTDGFWCKYHGYMYILYTIHYINIQYIRIKYIYICI